MAERLKDIFFADEFIERLGDALRAADPGFDAARFSRLVHDEHWEGRELKQRLRHVAECLHETLPSDYQQALGMLMQVAPAFRGFDSMVFPEFVGLYGLDDWGVSLPALAFFTPLGSSEDGIRPFLLQDPDRALVVMRQWAEDPNEHVRRLASEGCRPRLPWAVSLPAFKRDPTPLLPILEALKDDASEYVRKSVANNLNDISKDHPDLVLDVCESWHGHSKSRDWIVKRACRTLLKAGNVRAMRLFGFADPSHVSVEDLSLGSAMARIGDDLPFSVTLRVGGEKPSLLRLERIVYYVKARGDLSPKVFQITEREFEPGRHRLSGTQPLANLSTRQHYPGEHQMAIVVNGVEKARVHFELRDEEGMS